MKYAALILAALVTAWAVQPAAKLSTAEMLLPAPPPPCMVEHFSDVQGLAYGECEGDVIRFTEDGLARVTEFRNQPVVMATSPDCPDCTHWEKQRVPEKYETLHLEFR